MKKRGFGDKRWNGIGGKIDSGESVEAAMIRECIEEIGVTPLKYEYVGFHTFILDVDTPEPWTMPVYAFTCTRWKGTPVETEEMAPRWFDRADIPYEKMWSDDQYWLPLVLEGKKLITSFGFDTHEQVTEQVVTIVETLPDYTPLV